MLDGPDVVGALAPDFAAISGLDRTGVIVSARGGSGHDFISRYFSPPRVSPRIP